MKEKLKSISKSSLFYLPFKLIEGLIGIVSLSLYTRLFGREVYGSYVIVNTSVALITILSIGWLRFVTSRYIKDYTNRGRRGVFVSTLFYAYFYSAVIGAVLLLGAIFLLVKEHRALDILFYLLFYLGYTFSQLFVDLLLYDDKRMKNIFIITISSLLKPLLVLLLFKLNFSPYLVIVTSFAVVDLFFGLYAMHSMNFRQSFSLKEVDRSLVREFLRYGFPLIGLSITVYLLNAADKYVILLFWNDADVAVYGANYAIASAAFTLITLGLSKGFYPNLLAKWSEGRVAEAEGVLSRALQNYLFLGIPAALGLSFVSYDLAYLLLDSGYLPGFSVIAISAVGMFFFGLSEYFNKGFELRKDTFEITKNSTLAALLNLVLNVIFIPAYGYVAAAYTSLFSFGAYALICYFRREKSVHFRIDLMFFMKLILVNTLMSVILLAILYYFGPGLLRLGLLVLAGMLSYALFSLLLLRRELFIR